MPTPSTTLEGRLTDAPQRNQRNPNLVEFSIAEGTRYQDKKTGEWKDGQTLFARCKVWDTTLGNNIMNTLRKGMDVVALADVKQNSWTDQQTADTTEATLPTPSRTMVRCSKIRTIRQCSKIRTIMVPTISSQPHPTTRGVLRWAIRHRCRRTTSRNSSL